MWTEHVPSKPGTPYEARWSNHRSHTCKRATSLTRMHASVATTVNSRARCAASDVGLQASSQRTVAFWIGSFNAVGRPRTEPSILTHDEY